MQMFDLALRQFVVKITLVFILFYYFIIILVISTDLNYCRLRPCLNNGLCMNIAPDNYKCVCPAGFTGNNCEIGK